MKVTVFTSPAGAREVRLVPEVLGEQEWISDMCTSLLGTEFDVDFKIRDVDDEVQERPRRAARHARPDGDARAGAEHV